MQRFLTNPNFHPLRLSGLYVALFALYVLLPTQAADIKPVLSDLMLALLAVTTISAVWRIFEN